MIDDIGQNESRTFQDGEIVHLVKDPGAKWRIRSYEFHHGLVGGLVFRHLQGLPENWEDREFETADQAEKFVQQQIQNGKVPANRKN